MGSTDSTTSPSGPRTSGTAVRCARRSTVCAIALAVSLLGGCGGSGFQPLYGAAGIGAAADQKLAQVDIATIPGRVGQRIRNEMIFQTTGGGAEVPPAYKLDIAIRESVTSTLIRIDGDARSQIYNLDASFQLIRKSDNAVVLTGTSFGRAGFERNTSIFSNVRAREDAENRAAGTVGQDLKSRLAAFLSSQA
jgi:LPS-assembly lipoprotein